MTDLASEFSFVTAIPLPVIAARLVGAAVLAGLIGIEREVAKNTAGIRTNMLIGLAAAMFAISTTLMVETANDYADPVRLDPIRIIEAVTSGVAFLAAGVVIYTKGTVKGLTTGASMWLSGAIGMRTGLGFWPLALLATVTGIVVLSILRRVEVKLGLKE